MQNDCVALIGGSAGSPRSSRSGRRPEKRRRATEARRPGPQWHAVGNFPVASNMRETMDWGGPCVAGSTSDAVGTATVRTTHLLLHPERTGPCVSEGLDHARAGDDYTRRRGSRIIGDDRCHGWCAIKIFFSVALPPPRAGEDGDPCPLSARTRKPYGKSICPQYPYF